MRELRTCDSGNFNTGVSKCQIDFGKLIGALVVDYNTKLPANLTADLLEKQVHADTNRVYGIVRFVEYAKNGGEPQTATNGYGPEEFTGFSARKDTFTLDAFYPELHAAITRGANRKRGVYFFDENKILYGLNDGTDTLAPFPVSTVYSDATPHPTSSAKSTMSVTFAYMDPKQAVTGFDYIPLSFDPSKITLGLTEVVLESKTSGKYKLYEKVGGYDLTSVYGPLIAEAGTDVVNGVSITSVSYDSATDLLTIGTGAVIQTLNDNDEENGTQIENGTENAPGISTGADKLLLVKLEKPSVLYENGIKGIIPSSR